jgi:thiol:disulfide interchange protein
MILVGLALLMVAFAWGGLGTFVVQLVRTIRDPDNPKLPGFKPPKK